MLTATQLKQLRRTSVKLLLLQFAVITVAAPILAYVGGTLLDLSGVEALRVLASTRFVIFVLIFPPLFTAKM